MPDRDLILLALDDPSLRGLLERALLAGGLHVSVTGEASMLERLLQETTPSLIFIGEKLSGRDSLDLCYDILGRFPTLPVIMYADHESPNLLRKALSIGLSDVLFPPLKVDQIVESIRQSQKRAASVGDWVRKEVKRNTSSLEKRIAELETLVKLGRDITNSLDLDAVLSNVVRYAAELTKAEDGSLLLLDPESRRLVLRASYNFSEDTARTFYLPADEDNIAARVIRTGEALAMSEASLRKVKTGYLVYALIYVPLRWGDKVIGVLGVSNRTSMRTFRDQDKLMMTVLADYAAIAIENARLYTNTEAERAKMDITITNIEDAVIVMDQKHEIILINPAARNAFGLGLQDLTGKDARTIITHPDFLGLLDSANANPLKSHEIAFEDGRVFNAQYSPITDVGWAVTMQDITNLKMMDRIKSDFIHTVSHDLRSPLTAIMGYVELLGRIGPLNEQQQDFVRRIQSSVQSITALVNDLLDLGRIEAGFDASKDPVPAEGILRYTIDNLHNQINDKHIDLTLDIPQPAPLLAGNPIRLRQLLDNLVGNAVKYTPSGGKVSVSMATEDDQVIIRVSDTGVGIPLVDQPNIFQKFYRASNAPKGVPGTGLGLSIVKSIVDQHHGRIWLESTPGQGSTFAVILPLYKET